MNKPVASSTNALLQASRPRTFPLAIASILCSNGLALSQLALSSSINGHNIVVFALTLWVALALQILSPIAVKPPTSGHRYLHNLKRAKKNDRIFQYGIDKMEL